TGENRPELRHHLPTGHRRGRTQCSGQEDPGPLLTPLRGGVARSCLPELLEVVCEDAQLFADEVPAFVRGFLSNHAGELKASLAMPRKRPRDSLARPLNTLRSTAQRRNAE